MRLDIDYRKKKKTLVNTQAWWLHNTFLNNEKVTEEISEIKTNSKKKDEGSRFRIWENSTNMVFENLDVSVI